MSISEKHAKWSDGAYDFRWGDVDETGANYYTCEMIDTNCARNSGFCSDRSECCSGTCNMSNVTCVACINNGQTSCTTSAGCCEATDICSNGSCCRNNGTACTSSDQCCSGNTCSGSKCCYGAGHFCTSNAQCCDGTCVSLRC